MKNKILIICGPTSTGKTTLAINLAKKFDGEILSADSRQVYKGMDIGTGKDLPVGAKLKTPWFWKFGYYEIDGGINGSAVKIWGYDLADPKNEFSVSQYLKFADKIITDIIKRKKLPILVGGTGLYIKAVIDGIPTAEIPKNEKLRKNFSKKTVAELYEMLAQLDSIRAGNMNASDRKNPRRLIRAIEIATSKKKPKDRITRQVFDSLFIGFTASQEVLFSQIEKRVEDRLSKGLEAEIRKLLKNKVTWKSQSMSSLGYGQWGEYFFGKKSKNEVISNWVQEEKQYAKRQMTWFKKDKRIIWFDITQKDFSTKVEKKAQKWYINRA